MSVPAADSNNYINLSRFHPDYTLADEASAAAAGDYVELEALEDLILVCSACPSRVGRISGDMPRGAAIDILQDGSDP